MNKNYAARYIAVTFFSFVFSVNLFAGDKPLLAPHAAIKFIENKHQWNDKIIFRADLQGGNVFLEKNIFTYSFYSGADLNLIHEASHKHPTSFHPQNYFVHAHAYKVIFEGANKNPEISGSGKLSAYNNYFIGNDRNHWASDVGAYNNVSYENLYPGINMNVYSADNNLKYDLLVQPNIDPAQITLRYDGLNGISLSNDVLLLKTSVNEVTEEQPVAYQIINGEKVSVDCRFELKGKEVSFSFPEGYNKNFTLVIDPVVVAATYSGSTAVTYGHCATYDKDGNIYTGGRCFFQGYPVTTGAFQISFGGSVDIAISKLNPDGSSLIYATYVGGSNDEYAQSLVVNDNYELYIYGGCASNNYPTTTGCFDNSINGPLYDYDIVVTKLNSTGTALLGSTYVGGTGLDGQNSIYYNYGDTYRGEIIVDGNDNCLVTSFTASPNFPVTAGCYDPNFNGSQDAVVFKMNSDLSAMIFSTFLGGNNDDAGYGLQLDLSGDIYVCGGTSSNNFPTTAGTLNPNFNGGTDDGFISKLSSDGSSLLASTYYGTNQFDEVFFIDVDEFNNVYVYAESEGTITPTAGVYYNAGGRNIITRMDADLTTVDFTTMFGVPGANFSPTAFLVDVCHNIYCAGWGSTTGFPVSANAVQSTTDGSDFYLIVLNGDATQLIYATYFGSPTAWEHVDGGTSRFDKKGIVYEAVCEGSNNFPVNSNAWSTSNNTGSWDIAVFKIDFQAAGVIAQALAAPSDTGCAPFAVSFVNNSVNALQYQWDFGDGTTDTSFAPNHTFTDTGTYQVMMIAIDSNSCNISDTSILNIHVVFGGIEAAFLTNEIKTCDSLHVDLTNNSVGGQTYQWDFGDGATSTAENPSHGYTIPGTYTITFILHDSIACTPSDTFKTTVKLLPEVVASFTSPPDACVPVSGSFTNSSLMADSIFWDFGDSTTSSDLNPFHSYAAPGTYTVMLVATNDSSCNLADTSYATIQANPYPVASFEVDSNVVIALTTVSFLNTSTGANSYAWDFGNGTSSSEKSPVYTFNKLGDYEVCLTVANQFGCTDTFCEKITVVAGAFIIIPTAFTPNGDGLNDLLFPVGSDVVNLDLKVFNRWGELLYETNRMDDGWDGRYKGKDQPMGVYVYLLDASFLDGTSAMKKGNFTLIR